MISILVPTRNRPDSVKRLLDSAYETAKGEIEFIFYVDDDDESTLDVIDRAGATYIVGPRVVLSEMWNRCWEKARFDIGMHCGDDIVFRSDNWDQEVLARFDGMPDKILFVHGNDGFQFDKIGTHGFLHRRWVETVGYFVPPYFSSDYNDLWLTEVADALGRRVYISDMFTEHMHPVAGKGTWDQTHQERLARHQTDNVERIYRQRAPERAADVAKLRAVIENFGD